MLDNLKKVEEYQIIFKLSKIYFRFIFKKLL